MENIRKQEESLKHKEDYNNIPVEYCTSCLSLNIQGLDDTDISYCAHCGNTLTDKVLIADWEKMYEDKYKHKFINGSKDE